MKNFAAAALILSSLALAACGRTASSPRVASAGDPTALWTKTPAANSTQSSTQDGNVLAAPQSAAPQSAKLVEKPLNHDRASKGPDLGAGPSSKSLSATPPPSAPPPSCTLPETGPAVGFYARDPRPAQQVALTFDDGPHPGKTPKVLNLLQKHKLHATFFVVGAAIRPGTYQLIQRMVAEGHVIGSHSYNHDVKMAARRPGRGSIDYVRGQHEVTRILIDLALLAQSESDFTRLYTRVFEQKSVVYLPAKRLRAWPEFLARHRLLLTEAGYGKNARPYDVLYSRPPGGGPYLEPSQKWQREVYDTALREAGLVNVMWHDESGDTNMEKKHDFTFLTGNLARGFRRGGVVLIHDYIRTDALTTALSALRKSDVKAVSLAEVTKHKYGCEEPVLRAELRPAPASEGFGAVAAVK